MQQIVDIVIVTFNRLEKLQSALSCYDKQTMPFRTLIVVDNNSTDGTKEFLSQWEKEPSAYVKHVISLQNNVGGSGGFYEGEKYALSLNPNWVYIADDDAYPEIQMIEKFHSFLSSHTHEKISAICSVVTHINGDIISECRSHFSIDNKKFSIIAASEEEYSQPYFRFNSLSYVGAFLSAEALHEVGLVNPKFFIYQDDVEHSIRLAKYGIMYCVPDMVVTHDSVPSTNMTHNDLSKILWKEYYAVRNRLYMLLKHYPPLGRRELLSLLDSVHAHRRSTLSPVAKMKLEGCKDAVLGKLGLHDIYRPGLQIAKDMAITLPYPAFLWGCLYWLFRLRRLFVKRNN